MYIRTKGLNSDILGLIGKQSQENKKKPYYYYYYYYYYNVHCHMLTSELYVCYGA